MWYDENDWCVFRMAHSSSRGGNSLSKPTICLYLYLYICAEYTNIRRYNLLFRAFRAIYVHKKGKQPGKTRGKNMTRLKES